MRFDTLKSVAAAGIWVGVIASGLGAWARSDPSGPVVAENRHVLRMANGTRIEVVGVSSHPSGPDTWWRPDGRPLEKPPADPAKVDVDEDVTNLRAILIRVVDLPEGAVFKWRPTGGGSWGDEPTKDGRRLDGMQRYVSSFAANLGSCGVEVRVASGPWVTVCTHDNRPGSSATTDGRNRILFGVSREHRGGTSISLAQDFNPYFDRDTRVVAVDPEGHEHPAARLGMISGGSMSLVDAEFSLPPGRIRQYRLQARPFERGVIGDVSLTPRPGREE